MKWDRDLFNSAETGFYMIFLIFGLAGIILGLVLGLIYGG